MGGCQKKSLFHFLPLLLVRRFKFITVLKVGITANLSLLVRYCRNTEPAKKALL
jgi:hypothetical protein